MGIPKKKDDIDDFLDELAKDQTQTGIREKLEQAKKDAEETTEPSIPGADGTRIAAPSEVAKDSKNKPEIDKVTLPTAPTSKPEVPESEASESEVSEPEASKPADLSESTGAKAEITNVSEVDQSTDDVSSQEESEISMIHPVASIKADEETITRARKLAKVRMQSVQAGANPEASKKQEESTSTGTSNLVTASIKQANHLKVAQEKINELEDRVLKLGQENESLSVSSDSLNKQVVDLSSKLQISELELKKFKENLSEDRQSLTKSISEKQAEINLLKTKLETLEGRLKKENYSVRSKERELENRLELVRSEKSALLKDKDGAILTFKREIDNLNFEINSYKDQYKDLKAKILASDERIKKSVRALRVALGILEGTDE